LVSSCASGRNCRRVRATVAESCPAPRRVGRWSLSSHPSDVPRIDHHRHVLLVSASARRRRSECKRITIQVAPDGRRYIDRDVRRGRSDARAACLVEIPAFTKEESANCSNPGAAVGLSLAICRLPRRYYRAGSAGTVPIWPPLLSRSCRSRHPASATITRAWIERMAGRRQGHRVRRHRHPRVVIIATTFRIVATRGA